MITVNPSCQILKGTPGFDDFSKKTNQFFNIVNERIAQGGFFSLHLSRKNELYAVKISTHPILSIFQEIYNLMICLIYMGSKSDTDLNKILESIREEFRRVGSSIKDEADLLKFINYTSNIKNCRLKLINFTKEKTQEIIRDMIQSHYSFIKIHKNKIQSEEIKPDSFTARPQASFVQSTGVRDLIMSIYPEQIKRSLQGLRDEEAEEFVKKELDRLSELKAESPKTLLQRYDVLAQESSERKLTPDIQDKIKEKKLEIDRRIKNKSCEQLMVEEFGKTLKSIMDEEAEDDRFEQSAKLLKGLYSFLDHLKDERFIPQINGLIQAVLNMETVLEKASFQRRIAGFENRLEMIVKEQDIGERVKQSKQLLEELYSFLDRLKDETFISKINGLIETAVEHMKSEIEFASFYELASEMEAVLKKRISLGEETLPLGSTEKKLTIMDTVRSILKMRSSSLVLC